MLVDGHVAGQERQWIGITRSVDLHVCTLAHQIVSRTYA